MRKVVFSILSVVWLASAPALHATDIGVPSECEDVMLQAFYWDSYTLTKYGRTQWRDLLADTAAINANFDLVWFPPSAEAGGVGYTPKKYSSQDSDWGQKSRLTSLITALHKGNTKVIADIVINHRGNSNSWCTFNQDDFGSLYGTYQLTSAHICNTDEVNHSSQAQKDAGSCYGAATGAADTGTDFEGARDLDHSNEYVQNWAKAYLKWMKRSMKYDGFRYDMTLGYAGQYLSMYNEASTPYISVSEFWESIGRQIQHLQETDSNTMIFDFPLKYVLNSAIGGTAALGQLKNPSNSLRGRGYSKYAVTFVDNHDTFERGNGQEFAGDNANLSSATVKNRILQANAYILMMPGIPCVFWPHWYSYRDEINALIAVRKEAGIHSESQVLNESGQGNQYEATIVGHHGTVVLRLGSGRSKVAPDGYELAVEGGGFYQYTVFIKMNPEGIEEVQGNDVRSTKFIRDGQLYIRLGDKTFDILGNEIK